MIELCSFVDFGIFPASEPFDLIFGVLFVVWLILMIV